MLFKKISVSLLLGVLSLSILTACGRSTPTVDPSTKITEIASTVQAELTSIALLTPSATATPQPTATSTPAPATPTLAATKSSTTATFQPIQTGTVPDNAKFIADVTIPDYTLTAPSTSFVKTWKIQNTGTTTWTKDYKLIYLEGMLGANSTTSVSLPKAVAPGETIEISVTFKSPVNNGVYSSYWKMYTASGYIFGEVVSVFITVGDATVTPTSTLIP
jgi:hypothetical protein